MKYFCSQIDGQSAAVIATDDGMTLAVEPAPTKFAAMQRRDEARNGGWVNFAGDTVLPKPTVVPLVPPAKKAAKPKAEKPKAPAVPKAAKPKGKK